MQAPMQAPIQAPVSPCPTAHPCCPPPPFVAQVLSVDDDPVNQMVIQAMLGKAGFKVLKAADGQKALDLLEVGGGDGGGCSEATVPHVLH